MADSFQAGKVTTLHNITRRSIDDLEYDLLHFSNFRPMGLILPALYSELERPALAHIVEELKEVNYLKEIVIGLDRADEAQYRHALEYFSELPQDFQILWNDGENLRAIDRRLQKEGLAPTEMGKGRNVWYCIGYMLASGKCEAIGLHDCDVVTYDRSLLARLMYPVANPTFPYQFCKGYYARVGNNKLGGRVTRLLVSPLIRALQETIGHHEALSYIDSFRYPLAGEFSIRRDVLGGLRIPSDWGLEVGVLLEMQRNNSTRRICQTDIADIYDHKHQDVSAENDNGGLNKMSIDISKAFYRKLATTGVVFNRGIFRSLKATYFRIALDLIESYKADAEMNGLQFDVHSEEKMVELFAENLMKAGAVYLEKPMEQPFIPHWDRVVSAVPDIFDQIIDAVEKDRATYS